MRKQRGRGLYRYKPVGTVPPILTPALISKWKRKKRRNKKLKNQKGGFFGMDIKRDGKITFFGHDTGLTNKAAAKRHYSRLW